MTRWMRPPELDRRRRAADRFDPVVEGAHWGLSPDVALELWKQVCAEPPGDGLRDDDHARIRFSALARFIAARGGRLRPDVGKVTRVEAEAGRDPAVAPARIRRSTPGRETLVAFEARPRTTVSSVPGRQTLVGHAADSGRRGFDDYRVRALGDLLQQAGLDHALRADLLAAATEADRAIAWRAKGWLESLPSVPTPAPDGGALWRAAERHAVTLYRRAVRDGLADPADPAVASALQQRGTGEPLPPQLRRTMERALGVALAGVRIHTDAVAAQAARALGAEAFTLGEDIFFAAQMFAPQTRAGRRLLAHELTHVAQALRGQVPSAPGLQTSQPGEPLEQEAEAISTRVDVAGAGEPLPAEVQASMEHALGADFSAVRIHQDDRAQANGALAITRGTDIHFAPGRFDPHSEPGRHILGHELAHVVQLGGGRGRPGARPELEAEAERAAGLVARGTPASIELSAPASEYAYTDAAGNTLPDPIDVTWGSDPFRLEFRRDNSSGSPRLICAMHYLGPHPFAGRSAKGSSAKTIELWHDIATGPLKAAVRSQTAATLEIDLYGDGRQIIRIADEVQLDTTSGKARKHVLEMALNRATSTSGILWVRDPSAQAMEPVPKEDRPGAKPYRSYAPASSEWTLRIDGDGDQYKELEVKLRDITPGSRSMASAARRVQLTVTQLSSNATVRHELELPSPVEPVPTGLPVGGLDPVVKQINDGERATIIDLTTAISAAPPQLIIQPPVRTASETTYKLHAPGLDLVAAFPASAAHRVFGTGNADVIGNIVHTDLVLGAYQDKFRLTIRPSGAHQAVLGLSQLYRGQAGGGHGVELQLTRPLRFQQLLTGETSLGLDLDGDRKPDLLLYDGLTTPDAREGGGPPESNRDHHVRIVGAAVGGEKILTFRIRGGVPMRDSGMAGNDHDAVSSALAVDELSEQRALGPVENQLDVYEAAMIAARQRAVPSLLSQATFDAWLALSQSMIKLRAQKPPVDARLQRLAATQADAFYQRIAEETRSKAITQPAGHGVAVTTNEYAASRQINGQPTGAGPQVGQHIRDAAWPEAFAGYQALVSGLDKWIVDGTKHAKGAHAPEAQQLEAIAGRRQELAALEGRGAQPVLAVFQPDEKFKNEQGFVSQVPLSLYYWKSGATWHLRNLSNPSKPYEVSADAGPDEAAALRELIGKLDDPDRLPTGLIHYDIPGKVAGNLRTTDHLTWQKALSYLGLALAVVGFTLATFGTGGWAVAGAWVMAGSALAGGAAAGIDLADKAAHGDLDATSATLDLVQIVGALAGASALASGRITAAASNATVNARWAGNWARVAVLSGKIYLPAARVAAVSDVMSFAVITEDMARQLDEIEARHGDDASAKATAKLRMLIQFAALGSMASLSVKGVLPGWSPTRTLVLHPGPDGIPLATLALGADSIGIDSQIAMALEKQKKGLLLQDGERAMVAQARSFGDPRVVDQTATEAAAKTGDLSYKGVPISVERISKEYQDILAQLASRPPVGGADGIADRQIVTDMFFAVTEQGVTPTLATADPGIYNNLARRAGILPEKLGAPVPEKFPDGFDVTVNRRTIKVIPIKRK